MLEIFNYTKDEGPTYVGRCPKCNSNLYSEGRLASGGYIVYCDSCDYTEYVDNEE